MSINSIAYDQMIFDQFSAASKLFAATRRKAVMRQFTEHLLGKDEPLAALDNLTHLESRERTYRGMRLVPAEKIAGSAYPNRSYDRRFRPLRKDLSLRWIYSLLSLQRGSGEPVRLFKVWDSYYVADGLSFVSAALSAGAQYIEAEVWEVGAGEPADQPIPVNIPVKLERAEVGCEECV